MALFVIGDLHLSLGETQKPMDIFAGWDHHADRLAEAWDAKVKPEDTVVIPGDLSWAMSLADALADFSFVHARPGRKIVLKGNHDYYWTTMKKMQGFLEENGLTSISFLNNNAFEAEGVSICGTRGWMPEKSDAFNRKIIEREAQRLAVSLSAAPEGKEKVVFLHYPPIDWEGRPITQLTDLLHEQGIRRCYFGHLHGQAIKFAPVGLHDGIEYHLISADALAFSPLEISTSAEKEVFSEI